MTTSSDTFTLKILSGAQLGSEVSLRSGLYSFGSGDEVDLNFADALVDEAHGEIRLSPGKIELRSTGGTLAMGSGLALDGEEDSWHEIAQLDIITVGTTRFALGAPTAQWAKLRNDVAMVSTSDAKSTWRPREIAVPAALAVAFALYLGISHLQAGQAGQGSKALSSGPSDAIVANVLDALPFEHDLVAQMEADGRVIVSGYVRDVVERRAVRQALTEASVPVSTRVFARDVLQGDVDALLASQSVDLGAHVNESGVLTLEGRIMEPGEAQRLVAMLSSEVFGLAEIDAAIRTPVDVLADANDLLASLRLTDVIILRLSAGLVEATGVVPVDKVDNWAGFIGAYSKSLVDDLPLRSFVSIEGKAPPPPIVIVPRDGELPPTASADELDQRTVAADTAAAEPAAVANADTDAFPELGAATGPGLTEPTPASEAASAPGSIGLPASTEPARPEAEVIAEALPWLRETLRNDPQRIVSALGLPNTTETIGLLEEVLTSAEQSPDTIALALQALPAPQRELLLTLVQDAGPAALGEVSAAQDGAGVASALDAVATDVADMSSLDALISLAMGNADVALVLDALATQTSDASASSTESTVAQALGSGTPTFTAPEEGFSVSAAGAATSKRQLTAGAISLTSASTEGVSRGGGSSMRLAGVPSNGDPQLVELLSDIGSLGIADTTGSAQKALASEMGLPAGGQAGAPTPAPQLEDEFIRLMQATDFAIMGGLPAASPTMDPLSTGSGTNEGQMGAQSVPSAAPLSSDGGLAMPDGRGRSHSRPARQPTGAEGAQTVRVAAAGAPDLTGLSPVLIDMVGQQQSALQSGASILPASRNAIPSDGRCSPTSAIRIEQLPTLLFWMDYFSTNPNVNIADFDGPNALMFYELAISPGAARQCLNALGSQTAQALLENSVYLQETSVNALFAEFLLRSVPRFELDMAGLALGQQSYVELRDGRKLTRGMAPSLGSRIAAIGELGLLVRVAGGFEVSLYGDSLSWRMEDG